MKRLMALSLAAVVFCALPAFAAFDAFMKFGDIKGESTDKDHKDWIEISSFSWGAANPAAGGLARGAVQGCATNEIRFSVSPRVAPLLTRKCQTNERIQQVPLEYMNTRHVLEGVVIRSCSNNLFVAHFDRCLTHPRTPLQASVMPPLSTSSNGQLLLGNLAPEALVGVKPAGGNGLIIVVRNSPSLALHCAKGQHFPAVKLTCRKAGGSQQEYLQYTMSDVLVSSYQVNGDGRASIGVTFRGSQGSLAGFQDLH